MSVSPEVEDLLDSGQMARIDLIRFDLPGKTVGYHRGGRPYTYNGLKYLPNRFLEPGEMYQAVGVAVTSRTIVFSNIPSEDPDDAIAQIENFDYPNAPVIISHLVGDPLTDEVVGILASSIYEINEVRYRKSEADANGVRRLNIEIDLEPPGRSARGQTLVKRAQAEHQFDNDPDDTFLAVASTAQKVPREWGQRNG
jgi:hypothetical protein